MKFEHHWTGLLLGLFGGRAALEARRIQEEERALRCEMEVARRELEAAEQYFQSATDPELIDHAIYSMEAARRKYLYLYRRLRNGRTAAQADSSPGGASLEPSMGAEEAEWV